MKKSFLSLLIISLVVVAGVSFSPTFVCAKTVAKKTTVKKVVKIPTTMKWDAGAMKHLNNIASFDYSPAIRNAFIKKMEAYAKAHKIKVITMQLINSARI